MRNLDWQAGKPEQLQEGLALLCRDEHFDQSWIYLHGSEAAENQSWHLDNCVAWAWVLKPHEVEWLESMAAVHLIANNRATRKPQ